MRWVFRAYLAVAGLALLGALAGVFLPSGARVERSVFIERAPATVYTLAARPQTFAEWSPSAGLLEPAAYEFSGPEAGVGAQARWRDAAGPARLRIIAAEPYALVESDLDLGPRGRARLSLTLTPRDEGAMVNWAAETQFGFNLIKRYAGLALDRRLGADLEAGLERLKGLAESMPLGDFADAGIEVGDMRPRRIAFVERTVRGGANAQETAFSEALVEVRRFLRDNDLREAGPVYAVTLEWTPPLWRFRAAAPYEGSAARGAGPVELGRTPGGQAVRAIHEGDARTTSVLYDKLNAYIAAHRLAPAGPVWEAMITDRAATPPSEQITEIFIPIAPRD